MKNNMMKKCVAVICIWLMISLTFASAISLAPISEKTKEKIKDFVDVIPNVSAQEEGCCVKTIQGGYCKNNMNKTDCDTDAYPPGFYEQTSCTSLANSGINDCDLGVCKENDGTCTSPKSRADCGDNGGELVTGTPIGNIDECKPGCCVYRDKTDNNILFSEWKTYSGKCAKRANILGVNVEVLIESPTMDAKECRKQVPPIALGYCHELTKCTYGKQSDCPVTINSEPCDYCKYNEKAESHCDKGDIYYYNTCGAKTSLKQKCTDGKEICYEDNSGAACKNVECRIKITATTLMYDTEWLKAGEVGIEYKDINNLAIKGKAKVGDVITIGPSETACVQYQGPGENHYIYFCDNDGNVTRIPKYGLDAAKESICYFDDTIGKARERKNNYASCGQCHDPDDLSLESMPGALGDIIKELVRWSGADMIDPQWWDYRVDLGILGGGKQNPGLCDKDESCTGFGDCIHASNKDCVPKYPPTIATVNNTICGECMSTIASTPYNKCTAEGCRSRGNCGYAVSDFNAESTMTVCILETTFATGLVAGVKGAINEFAKLLNIDDWLRGNNAKQDQKGQQTNDQKDKVEQTQKDNKYGLLKGLGKVGYALMRGILYPFQKVAGYLTKNGMTSQETKDYIANYFGMRTKADLQYDTQLEKTSNTMTNNGVSTDDQKKIVAHLQDKSKPLPAGYVETPDGAIKKVDGGTTILSSADITSYNTEYAKTPAALKVKYNKAELDKSNAAKKNFEAKTEFDKQLDKAVDDAVKNDPGVKAKDPTATNNNLKNKEAAFYEVKARYEAEVAAHPEGSYQTALVSEMADKRLAYEDAIDLAAIANTNYNDAYSAKSAQIRSGINADKIISDPSAGLSTGNIFSPAATGDVLNAYNRYYNAYSDKGTKDRVFTDISGKYTESLKRDQSILEGGTDYYGAGFYSSVYAVEKVQRQNYWDAAGAWWESVKDGSAITRILASMGNDLKMRLILNLISKNLVDRILNIASWLNPINYIKKYTLCPLINWAWGDPTGEVCSKDRWAVPIFLCFIQSYANSMGTSQGACYAEAPEKLSPYEGYSHCSDCNIEFDPNRVCTLERCASLSRLGSDGCTYENGVCKPNVAALQACEETGAVINTINSVKDDSGDLSYSSALNIWSRAGIPFGNSTRNVTIGTEKYSQCRYSTDKTTRFEDMSIIESRNIDGKAHTLNLDIKSASASNLNFSYFVQCYDVCINTSITRQTEIKIEKNMPSEDSAPAILPPIRINRRDSPPNTIFEGGFPQFNSTDVVIEVKTTKPCLCNYSRFKMAEGLVQFAEEIARLKTLADSKIDMTYVENTPQEDVIQAMSNAMPLANSMTRSDNNRTHSTSVKLNNSENYAYIIKCKDIQGQETAPLTVKLYVSEWFNVSATPIGTTDYSSPELSVRTDRPAKCRYSIDKDAGYEEINDNKNIMDYATKGFLTSHSTDLPELPRLNKDQTIYVRCIDENGNVAGASSTFRITVDVNPPEIIRTYRTGDRLFIMTNEPSTCKSSFSSFSYTSGGTEMTKENIKETEHSTKWENKVYYIICRDKANKEKSVQIKPFTADTGATVGSLLKTAYSWKFL
jgi:hypothetical protein